MSKEFLLRPNGDYLGLFYEYIRTLKKTPRILWYPAAGGDYRALFYLRPEYNAINPAKGEEPAPPDIFLMTDFSNYYSSNFHVGSTLYTGKLTKVIIEEIEELPTLLFLEDPVLNVERKNCCNRVYFMRIRAISKKLGEEGIEFSVPVLYLNVVNGEFCQEVMIKSKARISHVLKIRYQGPGADNGLWLPNILIRLGVEAFITDRSIEHVNSKYYPELNMDIGNIPVFEKYREQPPEHWGADYAIKWYRVKRYQGKKEKQRFLTKTEWWDPPKGLIK